MLLRSTPSSLIDFLINFNVCGETHLKPKQKNNFDKYLSNKSWSNFWWVSLVDVIGWQSRFHFSKPLFFFISRICSTSWRRETTDINYCSNFIILFYSTSMFSHSSLTYKKGAFSHFILTNITENLMQCPLLHTPRSQLFSLFITHEPHIFFFSFTFALIFHYLDIIELWLSAERDENI